MSLANLPLDEVLTVDAVTHDPATGSKSNVDTITYEVYEEATDTAILSGSMTLRSGKTGMYRAQITLSAANGFEVGKCYVVYGEATLDGVTGAAILSSFRVVVAESVAGAPKTDVHAIKGDVQSATDLQDFSDTGYDPVAHKVQGVALSGFPEIDGVPFEVWGASLLAVLCGLASPSDNVIPFKRRDGTTTIVTVTLGTTNGQRTASVIVGE